MVTGLKEALAEPIKQQATAPELRHMDCHMEKGVLTIRVHLLNAKDAPLSSSGKNKVVFSSGGFQDVGNGVRVNLTAITKP